MDTHLDTVVLAAQELIRQVESILAKHVRPVPGLIQPTIIVMIALPLLDVKHALQQALVLCVLLGMKVMEIMDANLVMLENILQLVVPVFPVPMANGPLLQVPVVQIV